MSDEKIGANAFEAMKIQAEELSRAKAAAAPIVVGAAITPLMSSLLAAAP